MKNILLVPIIGILLLNCSALAEQLNVRNINLSNIGNVQLTLNGGPSQ